MDYRKEEYDKAVNRDPVSDEFDEYKQNLIKNSLSKTVFLIRLTCLAPMIRNWMKFGGIELQD